MTKQQIIIKTAQFIKQQFCDENTGHDWWHIWRAWRLAKRIGKAEHADMFVVEMAVLLHDLGDYKLEPDQMDRAKEKVSAWLVKTGIAEKDRAHILHIVTHMSYSKNIIKTQELSLEGKIVQDTDRLDAIGAVGIFRTISYSGFHGIPFYAPGVKPRVFKTAEDYKTRETIGIQHFYEKLLLLKDRMNTKTAKKIAACRHKFMERYLKEFFAEWEGKK